MEKEKLHYGAEIVYNIIQQNMEPVQSGTILFNFENGMKKFEETIEQVKQAYTFDYENDEDLLRRDAEMYEFELDKQFGTTPDMATSSEVFAVAYQHNEKLALKEVEEVFDRHLLNLDAVANEFVQFDIYLKADASNVKTVIQLRPVLIADGVEIQEILNAVEEEKAFDNDSSDFL